MEGPEAVVRIGRGVDLDRFLPPTGPGRLLNDLPLAINPLLDVQVVVGALVRTPQAHLHGAARGDEVARRCLGAIAAESLGGALEGAVSTAEIVVVKAPAPCTTAGVGRGSVGGGELIWLHRGRGRAGGIGESSQAQDARRDDCFCHFYLLVALCSFALLLLMELLLIMLWFYEGAAYIAMRLGVSTCRTQKYYDAAVTKMFGPGNESTRRWS